MTLGANLRMKLMSDGAVFALVGDRIFPKRSRQGAAPPMVIYRTMTESGDFVETMEGGFTKERFTKVEYHCLATSSDVADAISDAVLNCLANYIGVSQGSYVREVRPDAEIDDESEIEDELFRRILVLRVMHKTQ